MVDLFDWGSVYQSLWIDMHLLDFWLAALQVIFVDVVLVAGNAVVITFACQDLPPRQRLLGIILGAVTALVLRIAVGQVIYRLMLLPYLQTIGGLLLIAIAVRVIVSNDDYKKSGIRRATSLFGALGIIAIADLAISVDNILAFKAASQGHLVFLIFFRPIVVALLAILSAIGFGSLLKRFPVLGWLGGAVLGSIAGELIATNSAVRAAESHPTLFTRYPLMVIAAISVVAIGWLLRRILKVRLA